MVFRYPRASSLLERRASTARVLVPAAVKRWNMDELLRNKPRNPAQLHAYYIGQLAEFEADAKRDKGAQRFLRTERKAQQVYAESQIARLTITLLQK